MEKQSTVCVTGATGYIGSWLVLKLLQRGYIVHATLRNLGDESKVQLLKKLDGADERLRLFEADLYDAEKFELAINGCDFVFLVATPLIHDRNNSQEDFFSSQFLSFYHSGACSRGGWDVFTKACLVSEYKDTTEASLAALQIIMRACERSKTVKRVIYTASVMSSSPMKEEDFSFKNTLDETCWTPLHCRFAHAQKSEQDYIRSKTLTEKEFLSYNAKGEKREMELVSLVCALVGGNGILQYLSSSVSVIISPLSGQRLQYKQLNLLQEMLGSVPLVHIDDVCEAHIFCMEYQFIYDRIFCVSHWPVIQEIVEYYELNFPHAQVLKGGIKSCESSKPCNVSKLLDLGFKYKYNMEQILGGTVEYARRVGGLPDF